MQNRIHIIGVGSPYGDDRFGWAAAEALRSSSILEAVESERLVISTLDRPGNLLPDHWRETDAVIVMDAVRSGALPGTRHRFGAGDLATSEPPASSHGFGIAMAIELAHVLGNLPTRLLLRGVEIDPSNSGFGLSRAVLRVLPAFVREIEEEVLTLARIAPRISFPSCPS